MDQQSKNDNLSCCWFATIFKNLSVKNVFMFWCKTLLPLCQIYNISRILAAFACWHWSYLPLNGISSYPTHSLSNFDGIFVTQSKLRYSDRLKQKIHVKATLHFNNTSNSLTVFTIVFFFLSLGTCHCTNHITIYWPNKLTIRSRNSSLNLSHSENLSKKSRSWRKWRLR